MKLKMIQIQNVFSFSAVVGKSPFEQWRFSLETHEIKCLNHERKELIEVCNSLQVLFELLISFFLLLPHCFDQFCLMVNFLYPIHKNREGSLFGKL